MALLLVVAVAAAVPGVLRAHHERRLGGAASVLAGARVAVRCQSFGGAFVDAGPELGYVRWRADSGRLGEALMPDGYRSPDCRAGGAMDERLARRSVACAGTVLAVRYRQSRHQPEKECVMLGALLLGLVAGVIARMLVPSDVFQNMSGPTSWLASIALGLVGAILGYLVFTVGLGIGDTDMFDFGGIISAIIGTVIVILIVGFFLRRRGTSRL